MAKATKAAKSEREDVVGVCLGCGAVPPDDQPHPIIGVVHVEDLPTGFEPVVTSLDNEDFVGVAVCDACHRNPAHRTTPLKCHFFPRAAAKMAVVMAGSDNIQT